MKPTIYIYIYIERERERERETGSYENTNYLREREELRRCTKSHMIRVKKIIYNSRTKLSTKSYMIYVQNHIRFTYKITYDSCYFAHDFKSRPKSHASHFFR